MFRLPHLALAFLAALLLTAFAAATPAAGGSPDRASAQRPGHKKVRHARVGLSPARAVGRRVRVSPKPLTVSTYSPGSGATLSGGVDWEVGASGGGVSKVEFLVDGELKWTDQSSPYQFGGEFRGFDTTRLSNGLHTLTAVASGGKNVSPGRSTIQVTVDNPVAGSPSPDNDLVFSDDFNGSAGTMPSSSKWTVMNWCDRWGSLSCNTNRTQNISLDGQGNLRIRAIRENYTDPYGNSGSWTSGRVETQTKFSFTYGTIQARIKVPAGRGLWPAFWTNAASKTGWPATGEIDAMELLGHEPDAYYCSVHGASGGTHTSTTLKHRDSASLAAGFHVYEARWTPSKVDFFLDDRACGSISTAGMSPFTPQQLLVGMAVGGDWPGSPDSSTPQSADMLVDWVRAYS